MLGCAFLSAPRSLEWYCSSLHDTIFPHTRKRLTATTQHSIGRSVLPDRHSRAFRTRRRLRDYYDAAFNWRSVYATATARHSAHDNAYSITSIRHMIGESVYVIATTRHSVRDQVYSIATRSDRIGSDGLLKRTSTAFHSPLCDIAGPEEAF
jgi:hypothetical protein